MKHLKQALFHVIHGLFPNWQRWERKVATPSCDHRETKHTIKKRRLYWAHLEFNFRCARNHLRKWREQ